MATPLTLLQHRQPENWLIGIDSQELNAIAYQTFKTLSEQHFTRPPTFLLTHPDPCYFLAHFIAACSLPATIVLGNPNWAQTEWQQVNELVLPDLVLGEEERIKAWEIKGTDTVKEQQEKLSIQNSKLKAQNPTSYPLILIPTGGSAGKIRFATHTWETLTASVLGFCHHFEITQVNSLCVLPLYHVSGLMQFLRSLLSGGTFAIAPFKSLQTDSFPPLPDLPFFLSLVPTQLQRLLAQKVKADCMTGKAGTEETPKLKTQNLSSFTLLLGGAPAWDDLLRQAREQAFPLALTYGMTETASQIATLKPAEFLQGRSGCGRVLPHAHVTIRDDVGNELAVNQVGRVVIMAESLMLGYFPHWRDRPELATEDLGYFDQDGYLHIVGRCDYTIITGGENVYPAEVEAAIWATGMVQDVCVVGVNDAEWGQAVTAVYVSVQMETADGLRGAIADRLSRYKQPKHWVEVAALPRNAQGKLNRQQVLALLPDHLQPVAVL